MPLMIKKMLLKAGVATVAAMATTAALLVSAPDSASASGNCTHYGQSGYEQVFTNYNYQGDCWEFRIGVWTGLPPLVNHKVSSLRSWAAYPGQRVHLFGDGLTFEAGAGEWWASLPSWFNDRASVAY